MMDLKNIIVNCLARIPVSDLLDFYSSHYVHKVILGGLKLKPTDPLMMNFWNEHDLIHLIKDNTDFKSEGSFIKVNESWYKTTFHKEEPKTRIYRNYETYSLEKFSSDLFLKFESQESNDYQTFKKNFVDTLNQQVPKKSKSFEVTRSLILIRL